MSLNAEQKQFLQSVKTGQSVFLSGPAGTGKTHTIHALMQELPYDATGLTATTGMAALLIGGRTLHSFLGIGLGDEPVDKLLIAVTRNKPCFNKLKKLKHLIIDEVSMLSAELLDKISELLKRIKDNQDPFGGVQMIFAGDFYQLPPVKAEYAFTSTAWQDLNPAIHILTYNYRQTTDPELQTILTNIRNNTLTSQDMKRLKQCKKTTFPEHIIPTKIYSLNKNVDAINQHAYDQLPKDKEHHYTTFQEQQVSLCIGAQVMVTRNINHDAGIVNGTRGCVVDLDPEVVLIRTMNGNTVPIPLLDKKKGKSKKDILKYMPLSLAYAITVHKSQGATIDAAELDLGANIFEYGQGYTALSRIRSLKGSRIVSVKSSSFKNHPEVTRFYAAAAAPALAHAFL